MTTQFLTIAIELPASSAELHQTIVAQLQRWGNPLRWAITATDGKIATIEAVVTTD